MHSLNFYKMLADIGSPDRILAALGAIIIVSLIGYITGPFSGNANPLVWKLLDGLYGNTARKAYKVERESSSLAFRGVFFGLFYIVTGGAIGYGAFYVLTHYYHSIALEIMLLSFTLSGGAVWVSLAKLYQALKEGAKLEKGSYLPIAVSTRTNLNTTDDFGIARVGIAYMPKAFDKGFVAPLFWYLLGGLPLAYLYAAIACASWALAKEGYSKSFGDFVLKLERLFGFLPNVISGIFMMVAAIFTPTAQISRIFPVFFSRAGKARYAEGGFPLTATAWALNVSLGGPVEDLEGSVIKHSWIGPKSATARLDKGHIRRAIYMSVMAYVLVFAALVGGLLAWKLAFTV